MGLICHLILFSFSSLSSVFIFLLPFFFIMFFLFPLYWLLLQSPPLLVVALEIASCSTDSLEASVIICVLNFQDGRYSVPGNLENTLIPFIPWGFCVPGHARPLPLLFYTVNIYLGLPTHFPLSLVFYIFVCVMIFYPLKELK